MPPRERKPALAALAVLLILGGALATTLLVLRSGDRISAIRITQQVGAGQQFTAEALEEVQIADTGLDFVSWSQRREVVDDLRGRHHPARHPAHHDMGVTASRSSAPARPRWASPSSRARCPPG